MWVMPLAFCLLSYSEPTSSSWAIISRVIDQKGGSWEINYVLKNNTSDEVTVKPYDIFLRCEATVSNSSVPGHGLPREYKIEFSNDRNGASWLIKSEKEFDQCKERIKIVYGKTPELLRIADTTNILTIAPNDLLCVKILVEHEHSIYGVFDPLLGKRELKLKLGLDLSDTLDLSRSHPYTTDAINIIKWREIPTDRVDQLPSLPERQLVHLETNVPGNQYYRFPEIPVKYNTKLLVKFRYLIAKKSLSPLSLRITQYRDTPTAWKVLSEGRVDRELKVEGRWVLVEQIIDILPDSTTLAMDFRIDSDNEIGEAWVDFVDLETLGTPQTPKGP